MRATQLMGLGSDMGSGEEAVSQQPSLPQQLAAPAHGLLCRALLLTTRLQRSPCFMARELDVYRRGKALLLHLAVAWATK